MIDCFLMTVCGGKAANQALRPSAIYNWAVRHSVWWNVIVVADDDDILIAVLNDVSLEEAHNMLANA